jgi:hypothetical protein
MTKVNEEMPKEAVVGNKLMIEHVCIVMESKIEQGKITMAYGIKTLVDHKRWQKK